jgi:beta-fructofuranosidase
MAVSNDLFNWEKLVENPVTRLDPAWYDAAPRRPPRDWLHWRDPFLFEHRGEVYHYVCANSNRGSLDGRGTLGLAKTGDMRHWQVLPPPQVDPVCTELECPQVYQVEGRTYLIFSALPEFFSQAFQDRYGDSLRGYSSYAMVGESLFGPFRIHGSGQIIPPDYPVQPYANQLVFWQGGAYLLGTVWNDEQDYICDPIPVEFTSTGIRASDRL